MTFGLGNRCSIRLSYGTDGHISILNFGVLKAPAPRAPLEIALRPGRNRIIASNLVGVTRKRAIRLNQTQIVAILQQQCVGERHRPGMRLFFCVEQLRYWGIDILRRRCAVRLRSAASFAGAAYAQFSSISTRNLRIQTISKQESLLAVRAPKSGLHAGDERHMLPGSAAALTTARLQETKFRRNLMA